MTPFQLWVICIVVMVCATEWIIRSPQLEFLKESILRYSPKFLEKQLGSMFYCTLCLGFWIGLILSICIYGRIGFCIINEPLTWISDAFLVSILSLYFDRLLFGIDRHNNLDSDQ